MDVNREFSFVCVGLLLLCLYVEDPFDISRAFYDGDHVFCTDNVLELSTALFLWCRASNSDQCEVSF